MSKYYDQRCPDCETCGWLKAGSYPDGRPYEACEHYGYILHESVMEKCEGSRGRVPVREEDGLQPFHQVRQGGLPDG